MIIHRWGETDFSEAMERMEQLHLKAVEEGGNHLILCSHPPLFTVGYDDTHSWPVETVRCGRGGAVTAHTPGQCIFYFVFQAPQPARFYAKVVESFGQFFSALLPEVHYDRNRPGFYRDNRKIASLGFRYSRGVSLYGVALNVDVDLAFHGQVSPCGLEGVIPTSLYAEGVTLKSQEVFEQLTHIISEVFHEPVET
ncbi:MAG: hypothetical protein L3J47_02360 [Sulfurovum sp.]|nr:hypothetical protein [Sulfurovum sp.]